MKIRTAITIAKATFKAVSAIVALVEIYDFAVGMYRKHILKPAKVTGFSSSTGEPSVSTAEETPAMNAENA